MAMPSITITELAQVTQVKDEFLPTAFIANAKCIFDHDHKDIETILMGLNLATLNVIRDNLLMQIEQMFPKFPAKNGLSRSNSDKCSYVQDILLLGASVAKNAPAEHLEHVYVKVVEYQESVDFTKIDINNVPAVIKDLIRIVEDHNHKLSKLTNDYELLRNNNEVLRNENK